MTYTISFKVKSLSIEEGAIEILNFHIKYARIEQLAYRFGNETLISGSSCEIKLVLRLLCGGAPLA